MTTSQLTNNETGLSQGEVANLPKNISAHRLSNFVFSVVAELTLVFSLRSELSVFKSLAPSRILGGILVLCCMLAFALPFLPLGNVFHLVPLTVLRVGIIIGVTVVYLIANEATKKLLFLKNGL